MSELNGSGKRQRRTAAEKLRIVLAGMQADTKVSELCRREGITATQYYQWRDRLLASAATVFDRKSSDDNGAEARAEAELRRMKDVIAEITAENLELKKTL
jgi:transposase-like protein